MLRRPLLVLLTIALAAALAPTAALAAPRMWVGFQDDASFRAVANRDHLVELAASANASIIRATVEWSKAAPKRPRRPADPFDPAYRLADIDELVRTAHAHRIEVLLTVYGTPKWAGPAENRLPRRLADFQRFTKALASRYSGRHAGYPRVRFFSIWNEPNRGIFLSPQFDRKGRSVAPRNYAKLARAGYAGIKAGNRQAKVAIGETASHGRDRKTARSGRQDTHSPGRFAELVAKQRPRVRFDAWSHHPYPTSPAASPAQKMRWPNVGLSGLREFERSLDRWFGRRNIPIWITEYGHETTPRKGGISQAKQRAYLRQAFQMARRDGRVKMFVWFVFADRPAMPWKSGLITGRGAKKAAFGTFRSLAGSVDARTLSGRQP